MKGEPFATFRAYPLRFGLGLPAVFVLSLAVAIPLIQVHLSLATALLLLIQTAGYLLLYVPALKRRRRGEAEGSGTRVAWDSGER